MSQPTLSERLGIAGTGAIACGLARLAAPLGPVLVWARSDESADRARSDIACGVGVTTDLADLADCTYVVEAVIEHAAVKGDVLGELDAALADDAVLASTTSSLSITELAAASGRPERFAGLHVFNPVEKMALVELAFPPGASESTRTRTLALCEGLGKTAVEVPDAPGFVVNRLLFPYLFDAVRLLEPGTLDAESVDTCMKLGAGHPMGPLALLDFIGLDVAAAIGEELHSDSGRPAHEPPELLRSYVNEGKLGRKAGAGFYDYG